MERETEKESEITTPVSSINQAGRVPRILESIHEGTFSQISFPCPGDNSLTFCAN